MPVTIINLGAGLSNMKYRPYIISHILGVIPRAFAYGFFGSTLFEAGTLKFNIALAIIAIMAVVTAYYALKSKKKSWRLNALSIADTIKSRQISRTIDLVKKW